MCKLSSCFKFMKNRLIVIEISVILIALFGCSFSRIQVRPTEGSQLLEFEEQSHEYFMLKAIEEAIKGKTSVGAVIVRDGKIIAGGCNRGRIERDPAAHAEINAIRKVYTRKPIQHLEDCILYTTLEPLSNVPLCDYES